jgi:hypothetical protein
VAKEPKAAGTAPDTAAPARPAATKRKKEFKKKRERRVIPHGVVYIAATFNNTQITITDTDGRVVCWSSAGAIGFKGSRKGTPYAAQQASLSTAGIARDQYGMKSAREGPGLRTRVGRARAGRSGAAHRRHSRCDAHSSQRMPAAKAPPRLIRRRRPVPFLENASTAKSGCATKSFESCWKGE